MPALPSRPAVGVTGRRIAGRRRSRPAEALPPGSASADPTASEERAVTKVMVELSMSPDGYVTAPDVSPEQPVGRGGEALHDWTFKGATSGRVRGERSLQRHRRRHRWSPDDRFRDRSDLRGLGRRG
jgi:hypothetical protein